MDDIRRSVARRIGDVFSGKPSDEDIRLARKIHQAQRDSREGAMARLVASEPQLGELIWRMQDAARELRRLAATDLYAAAGKAIVPDIDSPHFAFGPRSVLIAACQRIPLEMMTATPGNGFLRILQELGEQDRGYPYEAIIMVAGGARTPTIVANLNSAKTLWTVSNGGEVTGAVVELYHWEFQAACVIGRIYREASYYFGNEVVIDRPVTPTDPWRDSALTALTHMFAKTLLGLGTDCPRDTCCHCNETLGHLRQVPPSHPDATGVSLMPFGRPRYRTTTSGPRPRSFTTPPPPAPPEPYPPSRPSGPRSWPPDPQPPYRPTSPPTSEPRGTTASAALPPPQRPTPPPQSHPSQPTPPPEHHTPPPFPAAQPRYPTLADNQPPGTLLRQYNEEHRQDNGHNGNGHNGHHEGAEQLSGGLSEYPTLRDLGDYPPSRTRKLSEDDLVTSRPTAELDPVRDEDDADDADEREGSNPGTPVRSARRPKR